MTKRKRKEKNLFIKIAVQTTADVTLNQIENYVICMLKEGIDDLRHDDIGRQEFPGVADMRPDDFMLVPRRIFEAIE